MTWFRVDDGFPGHPKLEALEAEPHTHALAVAAWTLMGADCAKRRTDGRFSEARLRRVLPWPEEMVATARAALLAQGLWLVDGRGLAFHDWSDFQPTKAELEMERKAATERQKRWRQRQRQARLAAELGTGPPVDASTNAVTDGVTNVVTDGVSHAGESTSTSRVAVDGAHPVPSRPIQREGASAPRSRPSADFISTLIAGVAEAFESEGVAAPKQTRSLTWAGWHHIAAWCEQQARIDGREPVAVAQTLVGRFLAVESRKRRGYPLPYLAENPIEYWSAA